MMSIVLIAFGMMMPAVSSTKLGASVRRGTGYEEESSLGLAEVKDSQAGTCTPSKMGPGRPGHLDGHRTGRVFVESAFTMSFVRHHPDLARLRASHPHLVLATKFRDWKIFAQRCAVSRGMSARRANRPRNAREWVNPGLRDKTSLRSTNNWHVKVLAFCRNRCGWVLRFVQPKRPEIPQWAHGTQNWVCV